jgi:ribosome-associated protein
MARAFKPLALAVARAIDAKKADDVVVLNVSKTSPITDYLMIATATSRPHLESLEHEIDKAAAENGFETLHRSKPQSASWRVLDFGGLVVHVMTTETRSFYQLEKLHDGAPVVAWQPAPKPSIKTARRAHARAH